MLALVVQNHPNRTGPDFRREFVRRLACHGSHLLKSWSLRQSRGGSVPIVAGVLGMPYRTFQLANFSSAFVWAAVLLKLGDVGAAISTWLWNDVVGKFWM